MNFLPRALGFAALLATFACGRWPAPPRPGEPTVAIAQTARPSPGIPPEAQAVLAYLRAHHEPPAGFEGGRHFGNYEKALPQADASGRRIQYQEWDVHPHRAHENRGVERIVTGSDGRAWYTGDHYQHFVEMREAP